MVSWLPWSVVHGLGCVIGFVWGHVIRHHRADAFTALKRSLPDLSPKECRRIINRMYKLQGINLVEVTWFYLRGPDQMREYVDTEGREHLDAAIAAGRGVIGLTAHLGNFELMPMATTLLGIKPTIVSKEIRNATIQAVLEDLRKVDGVTVLGTKNVFRDCLRALRQKALVGMVIDQNMTRDEGVFVNFFGKLASTSPGLAYMAAQSKSPVLPMFIYRQPSGHHRLVIHPPIDPPPDREAETIHAATQHYTKVVEDAIRKAPEQWIWMHRRWRTQPKSDQSLIKRNR